MSSDEFALYWGTPSSLMCPDTESEGQWDGSWFGKVTLAERNESWPIWNGRPMGPVCQLRLDEAPFVPPHLQDIAVVTVFVACDEYGPERPLRHARSHPNYSDLENGDHWVLRAYGSRDSLVELPQPTEDWGYDSCVVAWEHSPTDTPGASYFFEREDVLERLPEETDSFEHMIDHGKLGGWPTWLGITRYENFMDWEPIRSTRSNSEPQRDLPLFAFEIHSLDTGFLGTGSIDFISFARDAQNPNRWVMNWGKA